MSKKVEDIEDVAEAWAEHKKEHEIDPAEEEKRFALFKKYHEDLRQHNKGYEQGTESYAKNHGVWSHSTEDELRGRWTCGVVDMKPPEVENN